MSATTIERMAKKQVKESDPEDDGPITVTFRCEGELRVAFDRFIRAQRVSPAKSDVLIVAMQEFLKNEGFFPVDDYKPD